MFAHLVKHWLDLLLRSRHPLRLRSVSSGEAHLSIECCGKGWRRQSSLHPRSLGCEDRRGLVRIGIPRRRNLRWPSCECRGGEWSGFG